MENGKRQYVAKENQFKENNRFDNDIARASAKVDLNAQKAKQDAKNTIQEIDNEIRKTAERAGEKIGEVKADVKDAAK